MEETVIEIKSLRFGYKRQPLFRDLQLRLEAGNIYGLLGKNGAGKTTLLKLIAGLRFAQGGSCRVLGHDPARRPAKLLEDLYFIPEEFYVPPLTPAVYRRLYAPFYPRFSREAFEEYRREFELSEEKKLSELSYGQKKKFLLAFALASRCRLLLLDEPTNGLDIPSKSQFRRLLARAGEEDQIILVSTHQVRDMENLIDPVIILDEGRIIFQQPMHEVSRRLAVRLVQEEPDPATVLFADKTLGGFLVVRENDDDQETRIDLETLFNTVVGSRERVQAIFAGARGSKEE
jgi:ABC-2 type transport system ATP-binding protein